MLFCDLIAFDSDRIAVCMVFAFEAIICGRGISSCSRYGWCSPFKFAVIVDSAVE